MLLVYTHNITPRVKYVFRQICTRILGIPVNFTSTIEDFIAHDSLKMSYTTNPLLNELHVQSHNILFEQGLTEQQIKVKDWNDTKCFFSNGEKSTLPFDIFAASFYLLTRYEEYFPQLTDEYGRFNPIDSIAYQNQFLHEPVVDIWAYKFRAALKERFPDYSFPKRSYSVSPVIDVPMAFYFIQKGMLRTFGGTLNDIVKLKFKQLYQRYLVLLRFKKDPYDTFSFIINKQRNSRFKFLMFFLIGDYSTYDKNISINRKKFVTLIKSMADYCRVGLKVSFLALDDTVILKKEKTRMESIINSALEMSRNSFSKLNLPHSYRNLVDLEIKEDFTMGYLNNIGFRAGTCTPFLFYDMDYEVQTPLLINSFQVMDFALLKHKSYLDKKEALERIIKRVKGVNGTFVPVFHNYVFSDSETWKGFKDLFSLILDSGNEAE